MSLRKQRIETNQARQRMAAWLEKHPQGAAHYLKTLRPLCETVARNLDWKIDDVAAVLSEEPLGEMVRNFTYEESLLTPWNHGSDRPLDDYLVRHGRREKSSGRSYIRELGCAQARLWEIIAIETGQSITVQRLSKNLDPVYQPYRVSETIAGNYLSIGQCMLTRVLRIPEGYVFAAGKLPLDRQSAQALLDQSSSTVMAAGFTSWAIKLLSQLSCRASGESADAETS